MQAQATFAYPTLRARSGVLVVDGYGISIMVHRGRLVISDGIGQERRERTLSRASRDIRRIVLLGHTGYVTLEAIRWMTDVGISFCQIDTDGRLISTSASLGNNDARLRRAQALAASNGTGIEVARYLLAAKLEGEARNTALLPDADDAGEEIRRMLVAIESARSLKQLMRLETSAALVYWRAWEGVRIRFGRSDKVAQEGWHTFGVRSSPLTGGPRSSVNPINSLLNYLFSLLEGECTIACLAVGLDPGLGIVHADLRARESFSLDLMEAVRPSVEAWVLRLLADRTFRAADFHETRLGICRVLAPLTHVLAETLPMLRQEIAPVAETVVRVLATDAGITHVRTNLTQARRSAGRNASRRGEPKQVVPTVRLPRACETCGSLFDGKKGRLCGTCFAHWRKELEAHLVSSGPDALGRLRAAGDDPVQRPEVRRKIGRQISRRNLERSAWEREHERVDPATFATEILPVLAGASVAAMVRETGLSRNYCATIKAGKHVPHARHWAGLLRALA